MTARLCLALALLAVSSASAQRIFVLDPDHTFGGYIGGTVRAGSLYHQSAILTGGVTAIVVDRRLTVGLEGTALASDIVIHPSPSSRASLRMLYGGVVIAYTVAGELPVHPVLRATDGGGGVRPVRQVFTYPPSLMVLMVDMPVDGPDDAFFVAEPGLGIEATLGPHVRVELSALYRIVMGIATPGLDNLGIGGATVALTAKVGLW